MSVLEDDIKTTEADIIAVLSPLSGEFEAAMDKRADVAVFNWLMLHGLPSQPGQFRYYTHQICAAVLGWAATNGYLEFTDKARASEKELAARPEEDPTSRLESDSSEDAEVIQGNFGQYL